MLCYYCTILLMKFDELSNTINESKHIKERNSLTNTRARVQHMASTEHVHEHMASSEHVHEHMASTEHVYSTWPALSMCMSTWPALSTCTAHGQH